MNVIDDIIYCIENGIDLEGFDPEDIEEAQYQMRGAASYEAIVGWHWDNR